MIRRHQSNVPSLMLCYVKCVSFAQRPDLWENPRPTPSLLSASKVAVGAGLSTVRGSSVEPGMMVVVERAIMSIWGSSGTVVVAIVLVVVVLLVAVVVADAVVVVVDAVVVVVVGGTVEDVDSTVSKTTSEPSLPSMWWTV